MIEAFLNGLIREGVIQQEDRECYQYGCEQGLFMLLNLLTTVLIGLLMGMVWQSVLFTLLYIPLRIYAGGYHAKTQLRCFFVSNGMIIAALLGMKTLLQSPSICGILLLLGAGVVLWLAPVEDQNKPLDQQEKAVYRQKGRRILVLYLALFLAGAVLRWGALTATLAAVLVEMAGMLLLGDIKNKKILAQKRKVSLERQASKL